MWRAARRLHASTGNQTTKWVLNAEIKNFLVIVYMYAVILSLWSSTTISVMLVSLFINIVFLILDFLELYVVVALKYSNVQYQMIISSNITEIMSTNRMLPSVPVANIMTINFKTMFVKLLVHNELQGSIKNKVDENIDWVYLKSILYKKHKFLFEISAASSILKNLYIIPLKKFSIICSRKKFKPTRSLIFYRKQVNHVSLPMSCGWHDFIHVMGGFSFVFDFICNGHWGGHVVVVCCMCNKWIASALDHNCLRVEM